MALGSSPSPLLVLGGNGFLGLALVRAARQRNLSVTIACRGNSYWESEALLEGLGVRIVKCERSAIGSCRLHRSGDPPFGWVVDFSARSGEHVALAAAALQRVSRGYLLISSEAVYAPVAAFAPHPLAEEAYRQPADMSWLQRRIYAADEYVAAKIDQEVALAAHARQLCTVALRLPYVVGERDTSFRLASLILMLEAGEVALSFASASPISFIDADGVASAALHLASLPADVKLCGRAFNAAQPPASLRHLLDAAVVALGERFSRIRPALLPPTAAERVYDAVGFAPALPFVLDTNRLTALGWTPPRPLSVAVANAAVHTWRELLASTALTAERADLSRRMRPLLGSGLQLRPVMEAYNLTVLYDSPPPADFPLHFLLVPLAIAAVRLLPSRLQPALAVASLLGWWVCTSITLGVAGPAISFSRAVHAATFAPLRAAGLWREEFGVAFLIAELCLGLVCAGIAIAEGVSPAFSARASAARSAVTDAAAITLLQLGRLTCFWFLLVHKMSARFHGEGLAGGARPQVEAELPIVIFSHEAFNTWTAGLTVLGVYCVLGAAVVRTYATAVGLAFGSRSAVRDSPTTESTLLISRVQQAEAPRCGLLGVFLGLAAAVAFFETHHVDHETKMRNVAGWTGCVFTRLVYLGVLPATVVAWLFQSSGPDRIAAGEVKAKTT